MNDQSKDLPGNDLPDDILDRAVVAMQGETVPEGPPLRLIAATLHALGGPEREHSTPLTFIPRTKIMKLLTTAAGLLLIAGMATLFLLAVKAPSSAFGQALKQVREARSLSYAELITIKGQEQPVRTKVVIAEDGRKRSEILGEGGVTTITDAAGHVRITLIESSKVAIVQDPVLVQQGKNAGSDLLAWLQALKSLGDSPTKELGHKELEGKRVTGFVAKQGHFVVTMWVDDATGKPVRIEYDAPVNGADYHVAMTELRFDASVDESLFSFTAPEGYRTQKAAPVPVVPGGEESIIEALRGYTKRDNGKFPTSLAAWGEWAVLFSKDSRDGTIDAEATRVMANLGAITPFFMSMPKTDYAYLGAGKTIAQKDALIFWYKKPDGTYRAIYADLTARVITAEKLPKN